jgi:hypothetical protein
MASKGRRKGLELRVSCLIVHWYNGVIYGLGLFMITSELSRPSRLTILIFRLHFFLAWFQSVAAGGNGCWLGYASPIVPVA